MSVSKFTQPDMTTQEPSAYKAAIDGAVQVLARLGAGFAPRAEDTPSMKVHVDAGALFDRGSGGFITAAAQQTATITAPGSNSKIVRVYVDEAGVVGTVEGAAAASPVAPNYPAGCFPVAQVTIASATTSITNSMLTDERAFATNYGVPKNTFLVTSSTTFVCPTNAKFMRLTGAGAGGPGGGGCTKAGGSSHAGGGGGGSAGSILNRLWAPESLTIAIGAGAAGGVGGASNGSNATAASASGTTTITGYTSGNVITINPGGIGGAATAATPTAGAAGAAGAAPTNGVAGTAGTAGTTGASAVGGTGKGCGVGAAMSPTSPGGTISPDSRNGTAGVRGSGGGGGVGAGGNGGKGGDAFLLIEVF